MNRRDLIKGGLAGLSSLAISNALGQPLLNMQNVAAAADPFQATWQSLANYQVPEWFRDAKFGLWAHWSPQCQAEHGDWYARDMYMEGNGKYKYHCEKFGHPSKFGYKDLVNSWKAEQWDPEELVSLYKKAGAKYFVALANHHDGFDLFNSKHQRWNSTNYGPKKDIIGGWAKAAKNAGLPFGLSVHGAHTWSWMETSRRADKNGPMAGVPYDGNQTLADGKGLWWEGLDPKDIYEQNHPLSEHSDEDAFIHKQWDWNNGVSIPSKAYCQKFLNRVTQLIDDYDPELIYFDDTVLPLWPIDDAGLKIAAHLYNASIKKHGTLRAVLNGKKLNEQQRKCMVWDIERGHSNQIEPFAWQTDTCIGGWHYDRSLYEKNGYKTVKTVIHTLGDVVSKNGNLLLSIPVRGNGSIDEKERALVEQIAAWMHVNSEAIYGTRPWTTFGEGPALAAVSPLTAQGFNERTDKPFTAEDIRFTVKGKTLYAIVMGWPENGTCVIKTLGAAVQPAKRVSMLGHGMPLNFTASAQGLKVTFPEKAPCENAFVLKIDGVIA